MQLRWEVAISFLFLPETQLLEAYPSVHPIQIPLMVLAVSEIHTAGELNGLSLEFDGAADYLDLSTHALEFGLRYWDIFLLG